MATVIKIENLSKKYVIGHQRQEKYTALRDVMMHKLRGLGQRLRHPLAPNREETTLEEFWALKDINLEIKQGDKVGIIGRNGAGKSTLLKVLSRITEPTTGRISINGRVASLLEVGTGFHPELTGRENIYLNGAILGMGRADIKKNFDEIVAFAEVEKFLDTPVKRYSSGMYVRLAFAVAAHLEPEILVVDEVLAVGDVSFQRKCLGKMSDISKGGRTVLFVSHNMGAIRNLCDQAILLRDGTLAAGGDIETIISDYVKDFQQGINAKVCFDYSDGPFEARPLRLEFFGKDNRETAQYRIGEPWKILLDFEVSTKLSSVVVAIGISTGEGIPLLNYRSRPKALVAGEYQVEFVVEQLFSVNGFSIGVGISSLDQTLFYREKCAAVSVVDIVVGNEQYGRTNTKAILLTPVKADINACNRRII